MKGKKNIYIDSNVIVSSEIEEEKYHTESKDFMSYVTEKKHPNFIFFTSVFTSLELASAMIRRTHSQDKVYSLLYRTKNIWKHSINPLAPMPPKEMTSFTRLIDDLIETTVKFNTPAGDTIHAHTAALFEMHYFVTWNKDHFLELERQLSGVKVLYPNEMLSELKKQSRSGLT